MVLVLAQPSGRFAGDHALLQQGFWDLAEARVLGSRTHIHTGAQALFFVEVKRVELMRTRAAEIAVGPVLEAGELARAA